MKDGFTPKIHRSLDCKRNEPFYLDRRLCCFGKNSVMRPFGQAVCFTIVSKVILSQALYFGLSIM